MKHSLSNLSSVLYAKIKDEEKFDITKLPIEALGITYAPFLKRVRENRLLLGEIEKIVNYCNMRLSIQIDDLAFENKIEDSHPKYAGANSSQKDLYKIIRLTEEIGELRIENQRLKYENKMLKAELGGRKGRKK